MTRSVAIIGAGQIGYAATEAFLSNDWNVFLHSRTRPEWLRRAIDFEQYVLGEHPAPQADVVLDTIAFDEDDIARYDPDKVGQLIVISSASVYCEAHGRTLDEAAQNGFPEFGGPITEDQTTVAPGPETYSTRKVRMENMALELFGDRAAILRPCAIYGPHSRHPREWWFVKRMKDRRRVIPLAFEGESQFHTTAAQDIGSLAAFLANESLGGPFNIANDFAPDVKHIGQSIADALEKRVPFHLMEEPPVGTVGRTPWSVPKPFEVCCRKASDAGFDDFSTYDFTMDDAVNWLRNPADWRAAFPQLAAYPWDLFDYEAEDRFFEQL